MHGTKRTEINEEEFFDFARKYLSEAFPNPERVDCPQDADLIGLSEHPKEADPFIPHHLTCCSPCFRRYMEILACLKRRKAG
jgi:hypothetical protein